MIEKISIVIPVHDEEKRISPTLDRYLLFLENAVKDRILKDYEIITIINNTYDRSEEIIKEYQLLNVPLRCIRFHEGGKGFAVMKGFEEALKGDSRFIGFVDAD